MCEIWSIAFCYVSYTFLKLVSHGQGKIAQIFEHVSTIYMFWKAIWRPHTDLIVEIARKLENLHIKFFASLPY